MSFILLRSTAFIRNARKIVKKQPELALNIKEILESLGEDPFQPRLKSHKLQGNIQNSYSCSVIYDLRIIFKFVQYDQKQAILLETIGTHDEVY